jgi:hypothetical protein
MEHGLGPNGALLAGEQPTALLHLPGACFLSGSSTHPRAQRAAGASCANGSSNVPPRSAAPPAAAALGGASQQQQAFEALDDLLGLLPRHLLISPTHDGRLAPTAAADDAPDSDAVRGGPDTNRASAIELLRAKQLLLQGGSRGGGAAAAGAYGGGWAPDAEALAPPGLPADNTRRVAAYLSARGAAALAAGAAGQPSAATSAALLARISACAAAAAAEGSGGAQPWSLVPSAGEAPARALGQHALLAPPRGAPTAVCILLVAPRTRGPLVARILQPSPSPQRPRDPPSPLSTRLMLRRPPAAPAAHPAARAHGAAGAPAARAQLAAAPGPARARALPRGPGLHRRRRRRRPVCRKSVATAVRAGLQPACPAFRAAAAAGR